MASCGTAQGSLHNPQHRTRIAVLYNYYGEISICMETAGPIPWIKYTVMSGTG